MDKFHISEINSHIKEGIRQWANVCLTADADNWSVYLAYGKEDVMNVVLLFQHILSNIGIKKGMIDERSAVELGHRLHDLVKDMTGIDTRYMSNDEEVDC